MEMEKERELKKRKLGIEATGLTVAHWSIDI